MLNDVFLFATHVHGYVLGAISISLVCLETMIVIGGRTRQSKTLLSRPMIHDTTVHLGIAAAPMLIELLLIRNGSNLTTEELLVVQLFIWAVFIFPILGTLGSIAANIAVSYPKLDMVVRIVKRLLPAEYYNKLDKIEKELDAVQKRTDLE